MKKIMRTNEEVVVEWVELNNILNELDRSRVKDDYDQAREIMKRLVSGFLPQCDVVDEVQVSIFKLNQKTNSVVSAFRSILK